jgi:hypothetical protein
MKKFDYSLNYKELNLRKKPHLYRVGKGEQGVLLVEPYKSEILPFWRFKTPKEAKKSAQTIYKMFLTYLKQKDFIGMDMCRKFLQMGYTRSRRYANHKSGQKYQGPVPMDKKGQSGSHGRKQLPLNPDPVKAQSALIFKQYWDKAAHHQKYLLMKKQWQEQYG